MAKARRPFKINNKKVHFPMMRLDFLAQFRELLEVKVTHNYFAGKKFPAGVFKVYPTDDTLIKLHQNTLQFRALPSGFMLGYGSTDTYFPLKELEEPLRLSFYIEVNDSNFLNYTHLPYTLDDERIFYLNNLGLEKDDDTHKNVSKEQFLQDDDKIEITHPRFVYQFDEPQEGGVEIEVMDALGEVVFADILVEGAMACDVNLLDLPEAKYTLNIDGLEEGAFYTYAGLKPLFGVLDIVIDPDAFDEYSFFGDNGELMTQSYTLNFKARETRWNYLLVEQGSEQKHKDHEIYDSFKKSGYMPMTFSKAESVERDGRQVQSVWTETPIPMRERQPQKFKVRTKRGSSGVEWIQSLPCPATNTGLRVNKSDSDEVYSELIVYL